MQSCRAVLTGLVTVLALTAGCGGGDKDPDPSPPPAVTTPPDTPSAAPPSSAPPSASPSVAAPPPPPPAEGALPSGYLPLWPFTDPAKVRDQGQGAHAPWNLDAVGTALSFTRSYLGFTDLDRVTSRSVNGDEARIGVGYRAEGGDHTAAVIHLFRLGSGADAPWEVVGTDDTDLSLTTPAYGSRAQDPLTVAGRITGVDESLQARLLHPEAEEPLGEYCCLPAGGQDTRWRLTLPYEGDPESVSTIVVWTGGHLAEVERFAVTGIRP